MPWPFTTGTRVDARIFHSFHTTWIGQINTALNSGLLPEGYYALAEPHAGETLADVLTLHAARDERHDVPASPPAGGGMLVAEAPPRVRRRQTVEAPAAPVLRRPSRQRPQRAQGVHLLVVDLFPPGRYDPYGIHSAIRQRLARSDEPYDLPPDEPLTLAAYAAGRRIEIYLDHLAVGARLPEMPLFLNQDRYINVPLQPNYDSAYRGVPAVWREVLEGGARTT